MILKTSHFKSLRKIKIGIHKEDKKERDFGCTSYELLNLMDSMRETKKDLKTNLNHNYLEIIQINL